MKGFNNFNEFNVFIIFQAIKRLHTLYIYRPTKENRRYDTFYI